MLFKVMKIMNKNLNKITIPKMNKIVLCSVKIPPTDFLKFRLSKNTNHGSVT